MASLFNRIAQTLQDISINNFSRFQSWMETFDTLLVKNLMKKGLVPSETIQNTFFEFVQNNNSFKSGSSLTNIASRGDVEKGTSELIRVLLHSPDVANISQDTQNEIKTCFRYVVSEILNNIADHSGSDGTTIVQHYKSKKKIQFSALDNGIGFLANIRKKFPEITTQQEAIHKALEKGITASDNVIYNLERNAGYGLFVISQLTQEIAESELVILCQDTLVGISKGYNLQNKHLGHNAQCTLVCFEIDECALRKLEYDIDTIIRKLTLPEDQADLAEDVF